MNSHETMNSTVIRYAARKILSKGKSFLSWDYPLSIGKFSRIQDYFRKFRTVKWFPLQVVVQAPSINNLLGCPEYFNTEVVGGSAPFHHDGSLLGPNFSA